MQTGKLFVELEQWESAAAVFVRVPSPPSPLRSHEILLQGIHE